MSLFFVVQSLSHFQLFATPWTAARQASLSFTIPQSLLRFTPLSWWCHLISSSVASFSFCPQSLFVGLVWCQRCDCHWHLVYCGHVTDPLSPMRGSQGACFGDSGPSFCWTAHDFSSGGLASSGPRLSLACGSITPLTVFTWPLLFLCLILIRLLQSQSVSRSVCLTLYDSMDCSPPGSSVLGILQSRILEWVAMPFSRGSFWPKLPWWLRQSRICLQCRRPGSILL